MKIQYEISLSDMLIDPAFQKLWASKDEQGIKKVLYICGLDTNAPFEVEVSTHRNRQHQIVTCERWVGVERQDPLYMKSSICSQENKIAACEGSLAAELRAMNKQGYSGKFEQIAERYVKSGGDKKLND